MSIILDALRKAEAGRLRQDGGLFGAPLSRVPLRSRIPLWLPAVAILVLLSAGVGAYVMRQSKPTAEVVEQRSPATAGAAASPAPADTPPVSAAATTAAEFGPEENPPEEDAPEERPDVRSLSLEARATTPATPPSAEAKPGAGSIEVRDLQAEESQATIASHPRIKPGSVEVRDLLVEQGAPPVPPEGETPAPPPSVAPDRANGNTAASTARPAPNSPPQGTAQAMPAAPAIPSVDDLVASGQLEPPNLSLDMHAYSANPDSRFVYINMRRYHAGDTTREGAVIEEITPDGVILRLHGLRFVLQSR
jgi:hypothetical protein